MRSKLLFLLFCILATIYITNAELPNIYDDGDIIPFENETNETLDPNLPTNYIGERMLQITSSIISETEIAPKIIQWDERFPVKIKGYDKNKIELCFKSDYFTTSLEIYKEEKVLDSRTASYITNKIQLSKTNYYGTNILENCIVFTYDDTIINKFFKWGTNSTIIGTAVNNALDGNSKNAYIDIYGGLNVAWTGTGDDPYFSRSTNNGLTWSSPNITTGLNTQEVGIIGNSTGGLLWYWTDETNHDLDGRYSTNNGTDWSSTITLLDAGEDFQSVDCTVGMNDKYYCCGYENTGNDVWCANSTAWDTETEVFTGTGQGPNGIDVVAGTDGCIYVADADSTTDDILLANGCLAWATTNVYVRLRVIL